MTERLGATIIRPQVQKRAQLATSEHAATYETGSRNRFHRRTQALPLAVYDAMQRSDYTLANQIAVVMVVIG